MNKALFDESGYKKQIILFGIFFLVLIAIVIYLFASKSNEYIIVRESCILEKKGSKYVQLNKVNDDILKNTFNVYSDSGLDKNISIKYQDNSWYYFDSDYSDLGLKKVSVAYTGDKDKIKASDYDVSYYSEDDKKFLDDYSEEDYNSVIKSSYDLDGDGVNETIYTINGQNKASIFAVRNDKVIGYLDSSKSPYYVQNILDLDGNGKYEVIVSKGTTDYATFDTCFQIYSINGSKIKKIKDCK